MNNKISVINYIVPFIAAVSLAFLILDLLDITITLVSFSIVYGIIAVFIALLIVVTVKTNKPK